MERRLFLCVEKKEHDYGKPVVRLEAADRQAAGTTSLTIDGFPFLEAMEVGRTYRITVEEIPANVPAVP